MSRKERVQFSETSTRVSSNILSSHSENMLPPKFPILKSKGRVLANAVNRDLNQKKSLSKAALERQRENASKLASGRSVVDKANKENEVVRNKPEVKSKISQIHQIIQPQLKVSKVKAVLEEKKNKLVKSESLVSLYSKEETLCRLKLTTKDHIDPFANAPFNEHNFLNSLQIIKIEKGVKALNVIPKIEEELKAVIKEEKSNLVVKEEPKQEVAPLLPCINLDKEDHSNNEFLLGIYADDIHRFLKDLETTQAIRKDYLTSTHIMTQNMRALLVDWLFEVQHSFKLLHETIHIAIALLDRFMQEHPGIAKNELQLVGVTCVYLASKYEEMYPPDLDDLVDISAKTYTKEQILKMEQVIFSSLNYHMGRPSPLHFLRRYGRAGKVDITTYCLAKYFIDLSLVSYNLCHVPPSLIAASALYLSLFLLSEDSESEIWTSTLIRSSDYTLEHLKPVVRKLASIVWNIPKSKYQTVRNIYLDPKKLHSVSTLPELRSEKLYKLSQEVIKDNNAVV